METTVLIALGSNKRHGRYGRPCDVLGAAIAALNAHNIIVKAASRLYRTAPLGPPQPTYVNAAVVATTSLEPEALLDCLKQIERSFGRTRGRRWTARVLDLDIIAYENWIWPSRLEWRLGHGLRVPHVHAHRRLFVMRPLQDIAPDWRHPVLGKTVRQLMSKLRERKRIQTL